MKLTDATVLEFLDNCYSAGIKRPEMFLISKMPQVYNWLKGAFPRGILPTDVDGEVEINGHFLRIEFKHENALRNGAVPKGQMKAFSSLIKTERFTVLLVGTDDMGLPVCHEVWFHNGKRIPLKDCNRNDIVDFCKRWAKHAENTP